MMNCNSLYAIFHCSSNCRFLCYSKFNYYSNSVAKCTRSTFINDVGVIGSLDEDSIANIYISTHVIVDYNEVASSSV